MNHPRLCRSAPCGATLRTNVVFWAHAGHLRRYFFHTGAPGDNRFSRRENRLCQSSRQYMFFAALTLLLRSLPQSGHLNRILFLSCSDASNLATPHLLHVSEVYAGSTRTKDIPAPSALYVRICANSPHVCSSIVRLAAALIVTP